VRSLTAWGFAVIAGLWVGGPQPSASQGTGPLRTSVTLFPADGATNVAPDTPLRLTFDSPPRVGASGHIRVFDAVSGAQVDTLDLAVPPAAQLATIGGFTEGFHFYPVMVRGLTASVDLHPQALTYGHSYSVEIDAGAIVAEGFAGISSVRRWTFRTRAAPPRASARELTVAADGRGDFATVQGAVDFVPHDHQERVTIRISPGRYEEIVYFRQQHDLTFRGDDRERVVIGYANNERFNGPPPGVSTNEKPDTFPYRRAAFMADRSTGIEIANLTIENFTPAGGGQAEALLLSGGRNRVSGVTLLGHQDTAQFNDSVYVENSVIIGDTDFLWGRGPAYFRNTTLREMAGGPFMWVRSTAASHGFVFDRCVFETGLASALPYLARNTAGYPDSEVVAIDSRIGAINPIAWMLPADTARMRYWEFGSRGLDGSPVDVTQRHSTSRQLALPGDRETIANYRDPAFVLGGWKP
jgi:pectin methylesterase-like acyl-CoA thioesterase